MPDDKPLSDIEIDDLLTEARDLLGDRPGETMRGSTAISAARTALIAFRFGLLEAAERDEDETAGVSRS